MMIGQRYFCVFCCTPDSFVAKLDKRGYPYFMCSTCGSRVFVRGNGLRGVEWLFGRLQIAFEAKDSSEVVTALMNKAGEEAAKDGQRK